MKIGIQKRIGIVALGFLITLLFTLAVNANKSKAPTSWRDITLTVENKTDLYLTVMMTRLEIQGVSIGRLDVPPKSTRSMGVNLYPGQYNIISTPKKCSSFLSSQKDTWVMNYENQKTIILTDSDFSWAPIPPHCAGGRTATADYSGKWICPGRGWLHLYQQETTTIMKITGNFGGEQNEAWGKHNVKGGHVKGKVEDNVMDIIFQNNDGTYTTGDASLGSQKNSFSGRWTWYEGNDTRKGAGVWGCHR